VSVNHLLEESLPRTNDESDCRMLKLWYRDLKENPPENRSSLREYLVGGTGFEPVTLGL
jgi:hypothetical protein